MNNFLFIYLFIFNRFVILLSTRSSLNFGFGRKKGTERRREKRRTEVRVERSSNDV